MKCTVDKFLHVADHDVNQRQPNIGLFRRYHSLLVFMLLTDNFHRRQRIHFHSLARAKVSGKKLLHAVLGYTVYSSSMAMNPTPFSRVSTATSTGRLPSAPRPLLPARLPPTKIFQYNHS